MIKFFRNVRLKLLFENKFGKFSVYTNGLRPFNLEHPTFISKYDQTEMMESFKSVEFRRLVDQELAYAYKIRDYIKNTELQGKQTIEVIQAELMHK